MTRITDFAGALETLAAHIPLTRSITGKDITLDRMRPFMDAIGNPERRLKVIHVAGTSGKTSTCYYLASLLSSTGRKVGLTVSPHIDSVTERVQVNMQPLSESEFTAALSEFMDILDKTNIEPTYFELLVGFAYWYFDKIRVDYVIAETGLGGLHDATNIAQGRDKICVITDIGFDHMHILGSSVKEITAQKAGIIHAGNTAFMYSQAAEINDEITRRCDEVGALVKYVQPLAPNDDMFSNLPPYQQRNWALSHAVHEYIKDRDNLSELTHDQLVQSLATKVPGRMDIAIVDDKKIIMDGAHNEQKMQAFVQGFKHLYPNRKVPVLLSLKLGKEFMAVLPLLKPIASKLILTAYQHGQDLPVPSIDPHELAASARSFHFEDIKVIESTSDAYAYLRKESSDTAIITGSFYLIAQLRIDHKELRVG